MMRTQLLLLAVVSLATVVSVEAQADGNPHNWDRRRRCDLDYEEPCGLCEGYGGIAYGDENDDIILTTCTPIANASDVPEVVPVAWGSQWTLPVAYEVLITQKLDPFCLTGFPPPSSVGELCYLQQNGSKTYDLLDSRTFRQDIKRDTVVGDVTSMVFHQETNFWIVNTFPEDLGGIKQCICTHVQSEDGEDMYPISYEWIDNLVYLGKEEIGVEYIDQTLVLDHWAYGPHHAWSYPENGQLLRMWQPFNGLQIYPDGVEQGSVDPELFKDIPPPQCIMGDPEEAAFRITCDDEGFPMPEEEPKTQMSGTDKWRAETKVPRHDYQGMDFGSMSNVLNRWLNDSAPRSRACELWDVEELQQFQALVYLLKESSFNGIYEETHDNRRLRHDILQDIDTTWMGLNALASDHPDPMVKRMRRDGHCHEAVMWYVHHLTAELKELIHLNGINIPLLSPMRHDCDAESEADEVKRQVCQSYKAQVKCTDCHSRAP